ncbi:MAG TPA: CocE/NonD family hydrolase, partial [Bryobacteraceae bacterium]
PPGAQEPPDRYVYDPGNPTPDPSFYEPSEAEERAARSADDLRRAAEAVRPQVTKSRQDILVYTSAPFEMPYTMVGPVSAVIYASSSARDTDWFVHLVDVDPGGRFLPLIGADTGKVRARFRKSLTKAEFLKPGKIYQYTIDLWQTGITIRPGHRLRIELASADFPTYSRNLNTGGNNETETKFISAGQAVFHDAKHQSFLLLPRIPDNP